MQHGPRCGRLLISSELPRQEGSYELNHRMKDESEIIVPIDKLTGLDSIDAIK